MLRLTIEGKDDAVRVTTATRDESGKIVRVTQPVRFLRPHPSPEEDERPAEVVLLKR